MGAGNPLIRSFDEDRYSPTTYFLDFSELFEDNAEQAVKEWFESNERDDFEDLSEEEIQSELQTLIGWECDYFCDDYFFNLDKQEIMDIARDIAFPDFPILAVRPILCT